jgi:hypothetical protein
VSEALCKEVEAVYDDGVEEKGLGFEAVGGEW